MPKKKTTPTFIHEFPLVVTPKDNRILGVRLHAAAQVYNAVIGEGLKRLDLMRQSREWQKCIRLDKDDPQRNARLNALKKHFGLSDFAMQEIARKHHKDGKLTDRLDTHAAQKLGTRAWKSIERHMYGKAGRPRFKPYQRFSSIEGKSNAAGIMWRDGRVKWKGLDLKVIFDQKDKHGVEAHALMSRIKFVKLVRRQVKGKTRWYVQLALEGSPHLKKKNTLAHGKEAGIDVGPSTIAVVGEKEAFLVRFCDEIEALGSQLRLIQRKMDRSKRATNPQNYREDGTIKKGRKTWTYSNHYRQLQGEYNETHRKLSATRKRLHGELINRVLSVGTIIKAEKLSYRAFQLLFGRSVRDRAPGMFMTELCRKAENAGGQLIEFSTRTTKLSQTCLCGKVEKKDLSERWHSCQCGADMQRDLFSAYLAKHVHEESLSIPKATSAWAGSEPILEQAMERLCHEVANGRRSNIPASFGLDIYRRRSRSSVNLAVPVVESGDVVGRLRSFQYVPRAPRRHCRETTPEIQV